MITAQAKEISEWDQITANYRAGLSHFTDEELMDMALGCMARDDALRVFAVRWEIHERRKETR